jgi:hypothetical protein
MVNNRPTHIIDAADGSSQKWSYWNAVSAITPKTLAGEATYFMKKLAAMKNPWELRQ